MPTLAEITAVLEAAYPPDLAEPWDAVGLVCGDPAASVRRGLFGVDPVESVIDEALEWGAGLLVTHHPLLLKPVNGVPATNYKGLAVHKLITGGCGLLTAHTNADLAGRGVSDALAAALGLEVGGPILPLPAARQHGHGTGLGLGRFGELPPPGQPGRAPARALARWANPPAPEPRAASARRVARALPATAAGVRTAGDP